MPFSTAEKQAEANRRYRQKHRDKILAGQRSYREQHRTERLEYNKEHRNERMVYGRQYYQQHREEHREYNLKYNLLHKDEKKEKARVYYQNNRENLRQQCREYYGNHRKETYNRDLKRRCGSVERYNEAMQKYNGECVFACDRQAGIVHHMDGKNTWNSSKEEVNNDLSNLLPLCKFCHSWLHKTRRQIKFALALNYV